jgi:hypothetical protein
MALTLLGRRNGVEKLAERRSGKARALWRAGRDSYFDELDTTERAVSIKTVDPDFIYL